MSHIHHPNVVTRPHNLTPAEVEKLVQESRLLRVLQPSLQATIERAAAAHDTASQYIVESEGQLYLSFDTIPDDTERQQIYQLIQRYQLGENINLSSLPSPLRQLLQPSLTKAGRLLGSILIGAFVGLVIGILALALSMLLLNATGLLPGILPLRLASIEITAVIFVVFGSLGWVAAAVILYRSASIYA